MHPRLIRHLPRCAVLAAVPAAALAQAAGAAATTPPTSGGDTAWMLVCTVLVLLMTMPGIILFYGGMLRTKNALSVVAHTIAGAAMVTLVWAAVGYSLAFSPGNGWFGGLERVLGSGLLGTTGVHPLAPTVPEAAFFMFQLAFAIITFAIILGATAERMRLGATVVFSALWSVVVYAPVAHWVWHPTGWLAAMGHMDFAGGTVVHIASGASALVAAWVLGPRLGFGRDPMVPHNLMITVLGGGLLWAGWFGFNAGSAFEASGRAAGALLVTQVGACAGAATWGLCEYVRRGQWSVLGTLTGAIAGLIAITPASGFVDIPGALAIGACAGVVCFVCVVSFKARTGIDDALDVFALHGVGGLVGTVLTPLFASAAIAPVTAGVWTNTLGALAVMAYAAGATWLILRLIGLVVRLRVRAEHEKVGLDIAEHGETLSPGA
ncbi:MAG: ammonium transporter [Rubrivivax sp.]|jgi:Amt family ammonium transporter|nr:ammonium transporter [Rubrivivax sp.]